MHHQHVAAFYWQISVQHCTTSWHLNFGITWWQLTKLMKSGKRKAFNEFSFGLARRLCVLYGCPATGDIKTEHDRPSREHRNERDWEREGENGQPTHSFNFPSTQRSTTRDPPTLSLSVLLFVQRLEIFIYRLWCFLFFFFYDLPKCRLGLCIYRYAGKQVNKTGINNALAKWKIRLALSFLMPS